MSNTFRASRILLNGQELSVGGGGSATNGVTGLSITGGVAISGAISINAGNNITLTQAGTNSFSIASITGGVPAGGTSGQYLRKISSNNGDYNWNSILAGGAYSGITVTSFTPNANLGNVINLVLTGNITLAAPTGYLSDGQTLTFRFRQLPTGNLITWNNIYAFGTDVTTSMIPTGTTNAKYEIGYRFHESEDKWRAMGLARGF